MIIRSKLKEYEVHIVQNFSFIEELLKLPNSYFIIDRKVYTLYKKYLENINENNLCLIDAIEENKTIETVLQICEKMTALSAKRNSHLISFGGGIIQDITGFVSNILYRGISWTFVPTTLLASCDSCIGGKTSINYKKYKNLLGTFYPPDNIYICPLFFQTLTTKDFNSGIGEVIKFNIMTGENGLCHIENKIDALLKNNATEISECIMNSLQFKKYFIEKDEFDRDERIKLNFAHTFGHAIETTTQYKIPHGTAVAIGMILADYISLSRGLLDADFVQRSERILLQVIHINSELKEVSLNDFLDAIKKDKKQIDDHLTAILMTKEGLQTIHDLQTNEVQNALMHFLNIYYPEQEEYS